MSRHALSAMLDAFCPMHVAIDASGQIVSAGPTMRKVFGPTPLDGSPLTDRFEIRRPLRVRIPQDLPQLAGRKLKLKLKAPPGLELKGMLMRAPVEGLSIFDLSFGINVVRAVNDYGLTAADFAVTDLTVELLYLMEAKSAAMQASRQLNERLQKARDRAEHEAVTDALTGLSNRRAMDATLDHLLKCREPFALTHLDLDFFKAINDTFGHAAGDHVLTCVAEHLRAETRKGDLVARLGGDEFAIIFAGVGDKPTLGAIVERIVERLSQPIEFAGHICRVGVSAGTAVSGDYTTPDVDAIRIDADLALYEAKRGGRGRHRFFTPELRHDAAG